MVPASDPVTIKLYAQRRFYRPLSGFCSTYDDVVGLARRGTPVIVVDAHIGADVTALVLSSPPTEH